LQPGCGAHNKPEIEAPLALPHGFLGTDACTSSDAIKLFVYKTAMIAIRRRRRLRKEATTSHQSVGKKHLLIVVWRSDVLGNPTLDISGPPI